MLKKFSILVLASLIASCSPNPSEVSTPTPSPSASSSTTDPSTPTPTASPSTGNESPATSNGVVQLDHAITIKKDGAPLTISSGATRVIEGKNVSYVFGLKTPNGSHSPAKGEYALKIGYSTVDKSPTSDVLTLDDLASKMLAVNFYEGNEVTPPGSPVPVLYPTQFYAIGSTVTKEFSVSNGKLNIKFNGGFISSATKKTPDFTLEIEIKDAPLM